MGYMNVGYLVGWDKHEIIMNETIMDSNGIFMG
jgi:hypothetical protein